MLYKNEGFNSIYLGGSPNVEIFLKYWERSIFEGLTACFSGSFFFLFRFLSFFLAGLIWSLVVMLLKCCYNGQTAIFSFSALDLLLFFLIFRKVCLSCVMRTRSECNVMAVQCLSGWVSCLMIVFSLTAFIYSFIHDLNFHFQLFSPLKWMNLLCNLSHVTLHVR